MTVADCRARFLLNSVNRAVRDFDLIRDGDRIAVGVSGGKDSRTLLDLLIQGIDIPGTYDVVAVHIDGSGAGLPDVRPQLKPWFEELGVAYHISPLSLPENEPLPMGCFRCAWNRRKTLFCVADTLKCNKIALGHHADDTAVTTLMSLINKGQIETMTPRLSCFDGRFELIRPLIYLSEDEIRRYSRGKGWEISTEPGCKAGGSSQRAKIEAFLNSFSKREREQIRANLWRIVQTHGSGTAAGENA